MAITYIFQDIKRYLKSSGASKYNVILFHPPCRFMVTLRACQYFSKFNPVGVIFRIWNKRMKVKYGFQFAPTCKIGKGLYMAHYGNIVINSKVVLGKNCTISQGVTMGNTKRGKNIGNPTVGDRVWIGTNSVIVGEIKIGNDVLIAPLTFVNFDVPDKAVVAGNPAQIINYKGSEGYIENAIE
jgi:serine O-acetyltransferase